MEQYHQLTEYQRYQLAALRKEGRPQKTMAANLGVHPSTISRELRRNRGNAAIDRAKRTRRRNNGVRKPPKRSR